MDTAFDDWVKTYGRDCPSRTVIDVLANKWALYVLGALRRFDRRCASTSSGGCSTGSPRRC